MSEIIVPDHDEWMDPDDQDYIADDDDSEGGTGDGAEQDE